MQDLRRRLQPPVGPPTPPREMEDAGGEAAALSADIAAVQASLVSQISQVKSEVGQMRQEMRQVP